MNMGFPELFAVISEPSKGDPPATSDSCSWAEGSINRIDETVLTRIFVE